jgi:signal transduction histidine kinase
MGGGKYIGATLPPPSGEREPAWRRRYAYIGSALTRIPLAGRRSSLRSDRSTPHVMNAITTSTLVLPIMGAKPVRISRTAATALTVALVAVIAWFDYVTGDFSMAVFYLVPVGIATWFSGRANGWFIGLLSAAAWLAGDLALSHHDIHPLMPYWNAAMPAFIYGAFVELLSALQRIQVELEERVERRTASLAKANTELEAARMHFIESDKLESIGRLAAGVAHEVKNPLMTIAMASEYLSRIVSPTEPNGAAMIQDLREAAERANRVISEMLEFARPGALSLQSEDFQLVAERALGFVKLEISRKQINVVRHWCEPAPRLSLDRNKMEQVLVNVLMNAIQATPERGTLTLRTRVNASEFIAEIDDTGTGISAAHQAKLFEPFFTTKPIGQGTGLGLSVARQIIQLHGGTLRLANRPNGGARVTIRIPATTKTTS